MPAGPRIIISPPDMGNHRSALIIRRRRPRISSITGMLTTDFGDRQHSPALVTVALRERFYRWSLIAISAWQLRRCLRRRNKRSPHLSFSFIVASHQIPPNERCSSLSTVKPYLPDVGIRRCHFSRYHIMRRIAYRIATRMAAITHSRHAAGRPPRYNHRLKAHRRAISGHAMCRLNLRGRFCIDALISPSRTMPY